MIEIILAFCLIWNTLHLLSNRQESYVNPWSDYTTKLVYHRGEGKNAWGQGQLLMIPKNHGSTETPIDQNIESTTKMDKK